MAAPVMWDEGTPMLECAGLVFGVMKIAICYRFLAT